MGISSADFASAVTAIRSPLATDLFALPGVARVFLGGDFVTVTKHDKTSWQALKPQVLGIIMTPFVARLLDGESMTDVCREFGISRKTGYKLLARYRQEGAGSLSGRSRRPVRYARGHHWRRTAASTDAAAGARQCRFDRSPGCGNRSYGARPSGGLPRRHNRGSSRWPAPPQPSRN